jgi:hypothetical protein
LLARTSAVPEALVANFYIAWFDLYPDERESSFFGSY